MRTELCKQTRWLSRYKPFCVKPFKITCFWRCIFWIVRLFFWGWRVGQEPFIWLVLLCPTIRKWPTGPCNNGKDTAGHTAKNETIQEMSKMKIVKNLSFWRFQPKRTSPSFSAYFFTYYSTGQHLFSTFFRLCHFLTFESLKAILNGCFEGLGLC